MGTSGGGYCGGGAGTEGVRVPVQRNECNGEEHGDTG